MGRADTAPWAAHWVNVKSRRGHVAIGSARRGGANAAAMNASSRPKPGSPLYSGRGRGPPYMSKALAPRLGRRILEEKRFRPADRLRTCYAGMLPPALPVEKSRSELSQASVPLTSPLRDTHRAPYGQSGGGSLSGDAAGRQRVGAAHVRSDGQALLTERLPLWGLPAARSSGRPVARGRPIHAAARGRTGGVGGGG